MIQFLTILIIFFISFAKGEENGNFFGLEGFQANQVSVISDGDSFAQSYLGQELTPSNDNSYRDVVTTFFPSGHSELKISNSVNGTPEVFAVTQDGTLGVAIETKAQKEKGEKYLKELGSGRKLTLFELTELKPRVIQVQNLSFMPLSVDITANGSWVVVGGIHQGKGRIAILKLNDRKIVRVQEFDVSNLLDQKMPLAFPDVVSLVQFHPSRQTFSSHLFRRNQVAFFDYHEEGKKITVSPWGTPVTTEPDPFVGRFTKDGKHYISANWGRNFHAQSIYDRLPKDRSSLSLIELSFGRIPHRIVQSTETALSPEGIAVSNNGKYVATVSMKNSLYSITKPNFKSESTITLFELVKEGKCKRHLQKVADFHFNGILPEGGSFDLSGNYLLATVFQDKPTQSKYGILNLFRIRSDTGKTRMTLEKTVPVPHGAHHVVVR